MTSDGAEVDDDESLEPVAVVPVVSSVGGVATSEGGGVARVPESSLAGAEVEVEVSGVVTSDGAGTGADASLPSCTTEPSSNDQWNFTVNVFGVAESGSEPEKSPQVISECVPPSTAELSAVYIEADEVSSMVGAPSALRVFCHPPVQVLG